MSKPRVVKDYDKLDNATQEQIKLKYPYGFDRHLITFKNAKSKFVSALPFETKERHYLVRMTQEIALSIIKGDSDYDENGHLRKSVKEKYKKKYDPAP